MKATQTHINEAANIAFIMAVANTVAGIAAVLPTIYAIYAPVLLLAPLIGYGLLIGYWARFRNPGEPRVGLWITTILFNMPAPFMALFQWGEWEYPWLVALLAVWNLLMIYGGLRALFYDWALRNDQRYGQTFA